jgi:purine-binding chemotaxis protein CheW
MSVLHVLFRVGEGEYVLAAEDVQQMESFQGAVAVPGTQPFVIGIVQIRGRVIPVVDLRVRFGLPPIEPTLDSRIVVVCRGDREVGLLADTAREVIRLRDEQFGPPPEMVSEQAAGFINAVAQAGGRVLLRLDFDRVIGNELPEEAPHGA